jgi:hypothetical protein
MREIKCKENERERMTERVKNIMCKENERE